MFFKKFAIFTGKYLEFLFNMVAVVRSYNFIKKRLKHRCFLLIIANFLSTAFL